jgi:alpha-L-fucosidase 2
MDKMGVWFENFALPVVINECLMQSYDGTIRLFPDWPSAKDAEFHNLRAAGAFLVSATLKNGKVTGIDITSEAGSRLKMFLPWQKGVTISSGNRTEVVSGSYLERDTKKGEKIYLKP